MLETATTVVSESAARNERLRMGCSVPDGYRGAESSAISGARMHNQPSFFDAASAW